jgi:hypothetical protein
VSFVISLRVVEHAVAVDGGGAEPGIVAVRIQIGVEFLLGQDVLQITLVVLQHQGEVGHVQAEFLEVVPQALQALDVGLAHGPLGVGDEHQAVDALQYELCGWCCRTPDRVRCRAGGGS